MAQKFHGKKSGKKKIEKKLQKLQQDLAIKKASFTDTPLNSVSLFSERAKSTGSAFLSLSKGSRYIFISIVFSLSGFVFSTAVSELVSSGPSTSEPIIRKPKKAERGEFGEIDSGAAASIPIQSKQQFTIVQPEPPISVPVVSAAPSSITQAAPVSRPKIAFGLSMKKGLKK